MAIYRIKVETQTVINFNGKIIKDETVQSFNDIVTGNMSDVAKVMLKRQNDFVKANNIAPVVDNIHTTFTAKDDLRYILEIGACRTQICNKIVNVNTVLTLIQISERIG